MEFKDGHIDKRINAAATKRSKRLLLRTKILH